MYVSNCTMNTEKTESVKNPRGKHVLKLPCLATVLTSLFTEHPLKSRISYIVTLKNLQAYCT